ncbi:MAG: YggS family pyridoxal phosphate-dependent enzyme [Brevinematia bacterium]
MKPSHNYSSLLEEIEKLKSIHRIKHDIRIVVVTKYASVEEVIELLSNSPVTDIGENRVQEAEKKFLTLSQLGLLNNIKKHMVGTVQSNKVTKIVKLFDFIHSIENTKIPEELRKRNFQGELLLEVKTSPEATKHGIEPEKTVEFFGELLSSGIEISGLMTIAPYTNDEITISKCFSTLRNLKEKIENTFSVKLKYLSMGMSNDYKIAISEGANLLRIGTLIFRK